MEVSRVGFGKSGGRWSGVGSEDWVGGRGGSGKGGGDRSGGCRRRGVGRTVVVAVREGGFAGERAGLEGGGRRRRGVGRRERA